jgi:hypothetical protein
MASNDGDDDNIEILRARWAHYTETARRSAGWKERGQALVQLANECPPDWTSGLATLEQMLSQPHSGGQMTSLIRRIEKEIEGRLES